jgi:hypothetical protein
MDTFQKVEPKNASEFRIPPPESRKIKGGTIFYYPLPGAWGLDPRILPNAALSEKVAALTISQDHSERLLMSTPFRPAGRPLADIKRPMAEAAYVDIAGFIDLFAHWAKIAASFAGASDQRAEEVLKQAGPVLELLKVLRSYSSRTYTEGDAWVTHAEWVIVDIQ